MWLSLLEGRTKPVNSHFLFSVKKVSFQRERAFGILFLFFPFRRAAL